MKVKDVGRVELGAENYDTNVLANRQPGVALAIYQQPGSNAIDVANKIRETLAELRRDFPPGLQDSLVYDITDFIESSQEEVLHTLVETILLVILVIFIFLQDWRTTGIPAGGFGAVVGAIVGGCQRAILQLKNQRDQEDSPNS
jgi:HAE1 family hydrophobic/amphiphilic exporter-1